ncbi:MAG: DUF134 domain-containing protein [Spirochaetes bacterium]|nr:DUF134 domain-containing protein [Spirochaetota bacterium]
MARDKCCRTVGCLPDATCYRPEGAGSGCQETVLTLDEFEAIRLADHEGLYQEEAAARMKVSRQTFGRIIDEAHRKIADMLVNGKALRIRGGNISMAEIRHRRCHECNRSFRPACDHPDTEVCPRCLGKDTGSD